MLSAASCRRCAGLPAACLRAQLPAWEPRPPLWFSSLLADKWGSEEVAAWLEALGLGEYRDIFVRHDIQGSELILLERRDLKVQPPLYPVRDPHPWGSTVSFIPPLTIPHGEKRHVLTLHTAPRG